jgi:hypothetical protein
MADIFLSYAPEDRDRIRPLISWLQRRWSVWWPSMFPGPNWEDGITSYVLAADTVVVVWTEASVNNQLVKTAAAEAEHLGIGVAVYLDRLEPRACSQLTQGALLLGWDGVSPHPALDEIDRGVSAVRSKTKADERKSQREERKQFYSFLRRWGGPALGGQANGAAGDADDPGREKKERERREQEKMAEAMAKSAQALRYAEEERLEQTRMAASEEKLRNFLEARGRVKKEMPQATAIAGVTNRRSSGPIQLGLTVPASVTPGGAFVVRFAAYTVRYRKEVTTILDLESPSARKLLDLNRCQWRRGTTISVRLSCDECMVPVQRKTFRWDGKWAILRFDVQLLPTAKPGTLILRFDVHIGGFVVASLRPEIPVTSVSPSGSTGEIKMAAPRSAFASYSSADQERVLERIRSMQILADIDVFVDCMSLHPGEQWKNRILTEIDAREMFWLFWSREARNSPWVEWEWRTAFKRKGTDFIQPHPLEPVSLAPPPKELQELQFGNAYDAFVLALRGGRVRRWVSQIRLVAGALNPFGNKSTVSKE